MTRSATSSIVRMVKGLRGRMAFKTELIIRFDFGRSVPWVSRLPWLPHWSLGWTALQPPAPEPLAQEEPPPLAGPVLPAHPDHPAPNHVGPRAGHPVDAKGLLVRHARRDHAQPAVVINERRLQAHTGKFSHQIGLFSRQ